LLSVLFRKRAAALAAVGAMIMTSGLVIITAPAANADTNTKVWICKYSHTPELNETAQTVNSVDYHPGREVGTWGFEDAQSFSYVYGWSVGPDAVTKPDTAADCPPYNPGVVIVDVPAQPDTNDPCGLDNISFTVPADTDQLDWTVLDTGDVTVAPKSGFAFDQDSQLVTFNLPPDSGALCTTIVDVPAQPDTTDPCGVDNISFTIPVDTDQLDWTVLDTGDVTVAPKSGFAFDQDSQLVTFTLPEDSGVLCTRTIAVPAAPSQTDPCGPSNATWNVPADDETFDWSVVDGVLTAQIIPANTQFADQSTTHSYGTATDSGTACPPNTPRVTAVSPGVTQSSTCDVEGSYTVPSTDGVQYFLNGSPVTAGGHVGPASGTVTAAAVGNNVLTNPEFSFDLEVAAAEDCIVTPPPATDVCSNIDGPQETVPAGYQLVGAGECAKVLGTEVIVPTNHTHKPKPHAQPTVLGTEAIVPTAVDAGLATMPTSSSTTSTRGLLAEGLIGGGMLLLLAGGWLGLGRRRTGAHEA
jgi:hypothetical protein